MRWLIFVVVVASCDKGSDCKAVLAKAEPLLKQMSAGGGDYKQLRDRCANDPSDAQVRCVRDAPNDVAIAACFGVR